MTPNECSDRNARIKDVPQISKLLNEYSQKGILLPRPMGHIYENLRYFVVVEQDNDILACGALHLVWEDLGDIRSVAVKAGHEKRGFGKCVVERLIHEAEKLELEKVKFSRIVIDPNDLKISSIE